MNIGQVDSADDGSYLAAMIADVDLVPRNGAGRLGAALASAVMVGLSEGLSHRSPLGALAGALVFMATWLATRIFGSARRMRALGDLTGEERLDVVLAVDAGYAPDDPRLTAAVLVRVEQVRAANDRRGAIRFAALALSTIAIITVAVLTKQPIVLALLGIPGGLWQSSLRAPGGRFQREQSLSAAEHAARAARADLGLPAVLGPSLPDSDWRMGARDQDPPWFRPASVLAVTAVATIYVGATASHTRATHEQAVRAAQARRDALRTVGAVDNRRVWLAVTATTLRVRLGMDSRYECDYTLPYSAAGTTVPLRTDVCAGSGPFSAYVVDSTAGQAQVLTTRGKVVASQPAVDVGTVLPGDRLLIVLMPPYQTPTEVTFR